MSEWAQKRFWKVAEPTQTDGGFAVHLDARAIKTPAKTSLIVPTRALAEAIAAEWDAQTEVINPLSMPVTRTANAAIDKVVPQFAEVADLLAAYGDSDLLCYRATDPVELTSRQAELWDPLLDWAKSDLGAVLIPVQGVIYRAQSPQSLAELSRRIHNMNAFELAAFHDLVSLSGSLVLGFAAALDHRPANVLWEISQLDENWQQEQWGKDEEATTATALKAEAFLHAKRFFDLCKPTDR